MKRLYKPFFIVLLLAMVLFILCFYIFYGESDIFCFPLRAGVWGTVSDWAMVCATVITIIFVAATFISQKELLTQQMDISRIERSRYLDEILPEPQIECQMLNETDGQLRFKFNKQPAYKVMITNNCDTSLQFRSFQQHGKISAESYNVNMPMLVWFKVQHDTSYDQVSMMFEVYFSDKAGTQYYQKFIGHPHMNLASSPPLISQYEFKN